MILASHAILGAAVSRLVPGNPYLGFLLGVVSHFIADAVPHWDYGYTFRSTVSDKRGLTTNMRWGGDFLFDLLKIGADIAAGVLLSILIFRAHTGNDFISLFAGISGGVLPDGFQFLYFKIKKEPFIAIQKFHDRIHARPIKEFCRRGVIFQAAFVTAAVFASVLLRS